MPDPVTDYQHSTLAEKGRIQKAELRALLHNLSVSDAEVRYL